MGYEQALSGFCAGIAGKARKAGREKVDYNGE